MNAGKDNISPSTLLSRGERERENKARANNGYRAKFKKSGGDEASGRSFPTLLSSGGKKEGAARPR